MTTSYFTQMSEKFKWKMQNMLAFASLNYILSVKGLFVQICIRYESNKVGQPNSLPNM